MLQICIAPSLPKNIMTFRERDGAIYRTYSAICNAPLRTAHVVIWFHSLEHVFRIRKIQEKADSASFLFRSGVFLNGQFLVSTRTEEQIWLPGTDSCNSVSNLVVKISVIMAQSKGNEGRLLTGFLQLEGLSVVVSISPASEVRIGQKKFFLPNTMKKLTSTTIR